MYIATKEQVHEIEKRAANAGLSEMRLMENAGAAAARVLHEELPAAILTVILCGKGNNGGDGFVIARKLAEVGHTVTVILAEGYPATPTARNAFSLLPEVPVISLAEEPYRAAAAVSEAQLVVDAVYGIGFHGELPAEVQRLFSLVKPQQRRYAVDIPSGVHCDEETAAKGAFVAEETLTFIALKPALTAAGLRGIYGNVRVLPIGVDNADITAVLQTDVLCSADVAACIKPRSADSHKGSFGHMLAVCGSYGMAGAAILSARAALRSGVGLLTVALPRSVYPIVAAAVPEAVYLPLPETDAGTLSAVALSPLLAALHGKDAMLIGCGLGQNADVRAVVQALLENADCPTVLDADGLNCCAAHIDMLKTAKAPLILTPHPGEMARLCGETAEAVQRERRETAVGFAKRYGVTLVLKGHHTLVANADTLCVNHTGNAGMATGGSGDVLAGMIAALAAQGLSPLDAARCGVYLHGTAGDRACARLSQHGMLPSDMIEELGALFSQFE